MFGVPKERERRTREQQACGKPAMSFHGELARPHRRGRPPPFALHRAAQSGIDSVRLSRCNSALSQTAPRLPARSCLISWTQSGPLCRRWATPRPVRSLMTWIGGGRSAYRSMTPGWTVTAPLNMRPTSNSAGAHWPKGRETSIRPPIPRLYVRPVGPVAADVLGLRRLFHRHPTVATCRHSAIRRQRGPRCRT
jgi:hypothetical protein